MGAVAAGREGRAAAIGMIVALIVALTMLVAPATSASATTAPPVSGYPGETVTVLITNQFTGPANSLWVTTAPPQTTILAASGSNSSGSTPFGCTITGGGAGANCGPAGAGGWASGNVVTLTLAIAATAPAGPAVGSSVINGGEGGSFTVTVLAPPAPVITAPANGATTLETQPVITGSKRAGNSASVSDGGTELCAIPADGATTWSCTPSAPFAFGSHTFTATQASPAGDVSPASAPVQITVIEPAALALAQGGPATAVPGVPIVRTVTLTNNGPGTALAPGLSVDAGTLAVSDCTLDGTAVDCADLAPGITLGDLAAGGVATIRMTVTAPAGTPIGTAFTIAAAATSTSDAASPVPSDATLTAAAPPPPAITSPAAGSSTQNRRPTIAGNGMPGATVTVFDERGVLCTAVVSDGGAWSCRPSSALPFGSRLLTAQQTIAGLTSADSAAVRFRVVAPPPPPTPEPTPTPTPVPTPEPSSDPPTALPMDLRFSAVRIAPGTAAPMRGTLGPNASAETVTITLRGTVTKGMAYRSVIVEPDGECDWTTLTFTCTVELEPGESAEVEIRLYADALNAPDIARQQLVVDSSLAAQSNAVTSTINVALVNDTADLAAQISGFPGPFIPLLALFLLALAAWTTERRRGL